LNSFSADIIIQAEDVGAAVDFYVDVLGFEVQGDGPMISLPGEHINLFIEQGPALGPVLELNVGDVEGMKRHLLASGCQLIKDEPEYPRCYVRDRFGLTYNLH
jgi:catechol 2,3-dioxygenase-like lactoylglutathione lyase family enzyme